ncbi:MAG: hypothetical protein DWB56_05545 [Candidatus Jettenia sp.]|uniref:Calcineurin-like phosphoesterase domain-containing protein n=2 Tax=Candidatus Jettenia TaxID=360731 RepID=I3IRM0_9BACT|nr:MAG: hypothetical protein EDM77_05005 [Candidatus Jettenia sp. AMX1]MBC6928419.1 hypothetical protein [Candidatus Jettenia sp.]GAB63315.1 hypothetical protein KSU1_D0006 [Candidatus Jettenia caeni]MCE7879652.1 hypothetical protein [Candidatus Jettenia sp. AMX1]MCQ3926520.1 hypothetical protein [Candidatus Jettenia sp.]
MPMRKQTHVTFLISNFLLLFCIFSQDLYAKTLHFIAYGDTRGDIKVIGKPQVKHNTIAMAIRSMDPDFILFSGDMVYYNEFEKFLEVITNNYTGDTTIPLYPAIGNHELMFSEKVDELVKEVLRKMGIADKPEEESDSLPSGPSDDSTLEKVWKKLLEEINSLVESRIKTRSREVLCEEIRDKLPPSSSSYLKEVLKGTAEDQSWYSFIRKANGLEIKFLILNSSLPDDEEQFQWFLNELQQFSGPKIILEHYPPYSLGIHGCADLMDKESRASRFRDRYVRFFNDSANNVLLIINGHEHNYQRICRTHTTGNVQLPVYIISGGGGAPLAGMGECNTSQIPFDGFQCVEFITAYHFVDIIVRTNNNNKVILQGKVFGLRYDLAKGLPDDSAFERQFVKERLELIDDFTLHWQK